MKRKLIYSLIGLLILILSMGAYIVIPGSSTNIEKVADSLQPGDYWKLTNRRVEPAYRLCLGGNQCPSVRKDWQTDQAVSKESFESILKNTGWALTSNGTCEPRQNVTGEGPVCSASGKVNGFDIQLYLNKDKDTAYSKLQLFVNPSS